MSRLLDRLQEPEVDGCAVDGLGRFEAHRAVLRRKAQIREVFNIKLSSSWIGGFFQAKVWSWSWEQVCIQ